MYDTIIANATVYSGLNEHPQKTNIAIENERIVAISPNLHAEQAQHYIDATGLILSPGFIDPHASTGFGYFFPNAADHKLYQGITTEVFGNCGTSPAPIGDGLMDTMNQLSEDIGFPFNWRSLSEYFSAISDKIQFNIATLVGHSTLRGSHLKDWKQLQKGELSAMKQSLSQAMDEGALGLSTGLIYAPGCFGSLEEIVELCKVTKAKGGVYASHIRDERDEIEAAVDEALTIGKQADIPVLVSHLKAAERQNWGKIPKVLEKIEAYNAQKGVQATVDVYPYTAVSTKLRAFVPKYILKDGIAAVAKKVQQPSVIADIEQWINKKGYDLSRMMVISNDFAEFFNKSIAEIAELTQQSNAEAIAMILAKSTEVWVVYHCIAEADMDAAINWQNAMICTDSWSYPINAPTIIGHPHPRSYGAFTTFLEKYVLQKKSLTWQEAIHKTTYLPAQFFNLKQRGQIKKGYYADLVLLNPQRVKANATFTHPKQLSEGVEYLWVNGKMVIKNRKMQDIQSGKVLKINN